MLPYLVGDREGCETQYEPIAWGTTATTTRAARTRAAGT